MDNSDLQEFFKAITDFDNASGVCAKSTKTLILLEKVFISIPHEEVEEKEELIFKDSLKGLLKESSKFKNYNIKKGYKNLNSIKKIKKDSLNLSI